MHLKNLELENFRNHRKSSFEFSKDPTFIVGPNTSGKTNLLESISFLSTGKSTKGAKDEEVVRTGESIVRVKGKTSDVELEVLIVLPDAQSVGRSRRKYLVNGVS
ncbi:MAG: AAA family ATPase, partial [Candidatus Levyibacteriota bacterium]